MSGILASLEFEQIAVYKPGEVEYEKSVATALSAVPLRETFIRSSAYTSCPGSGHCEVPHRV